MCSILSPSTTNVHIYETHTRDCRPFNRPIIVEMHYSEAAAAAETEHHHHNHATTTRQCGLPKTHALLGRSVDRGLSRALLAGLQEKLVLQALKVRIVLFSCRELCVKLCDRR